MCVRAGPNQRKPHYVANICHLFARSLLQWFCCVRIVPNKWPWPVQNTSQKRCIALGRKKRRTLQPKNQWLFWAWLENCVLASCRRHNSEIHITPLLLLRGPITHHWCPLRTIACMTLYSIGSPPDMDKSWRLVHYISTSQIASSLCFIGLWTRRSKVYIGKVDRFLPSQRAMQSGAPGPTANAWAERSKPVDHCCHGIDEFLTTMRQEIWVKKFEYSFCLTTEVFLWCFHCFFVFLFNDSSVFLF